MTASTSGTPPVLSQEAPSSTYLPADAEGATLVGRLWNPQEHGPSPVLVRDGDVFDLSAAFATMRDLCEEPNLRFPPNRGGISYKE